MEFVLHAADELINIKKLDNDEYEFTTEHNYLFYSGKSFLKNLQIDNLQHYIDYCEEKQLFKIDMVNDDFILTLPIPFTNKNELIRMGKPDLDETQKLKKELEKKDKQIKNLQLLNSIITKKHDIIVDSLDNYRIDDDEISKLNEIVNEQREEISKLNNDLTGEKATVIALNNDLIAEQCKVKINPPNLNPKFHTLRLDLNRVCNYKIMSIDGEKYGDFLFEHYNLNGDSWRNIIESLQNYLKWQIVSGHFINRASDGSEYTAYLTFIEVYPLPISNKITKKYTNIMYEYDGIKNIYKLYFK